MRPSAPSSPVLSNRMSVIVPQASLPDEVLDRVLQCFKWYRRNIGVANNEYKVVAWSDMRQHQAHCLACAAFRAITDDRIANAFRNDKSAAGLSTTARSAIKQNQAAFPTAAFATHALKLVWAS